MQPASPCSVNRMLPSFDFVVEPYLSGVRIDSFLARHLRNYTTWKLNRLVEAGAATIDGIAAEATQRVFRGQCVNVFLLEPPDKLLAPSAIPLTIVYEDPWVLVVDKPAGMVAHPIGDFQDGTLSNAIQHHMDQTSVCRGILRPGIVHRLDRMTSGLMVVAKEHAAHRALSVDFQKGRSSKSYIAIVEGHVAFESRTIDFPIGQRPGCNTILMSARSDARNPRSARTDIIVRRQLGSHTLVECLLHTGRNHQIRVHLAEIGHPVVGDEYYGPFGELTKAAESKRRPPTDRRHALHASRLSFQHPILKERLSFHCAPPADFWMTLGGRQLAQKSV